LITCTASDDHASGVLTDSFTFTLQYISCVNNAPEWLETIDQHTMTDEETSTIALPAYNEFNSHDSVSFSNIVVATGTSSSAITFSGSNMIITTTTSMVKQTYEVDIIITDDNSCMDSAGEMSNSFTFFWTVTDRNEAPFFTNKEGNIPFCVNKNTSRKEQNGPDLLDPNPGDELQTEFSTTCSFIKFESST